MLARPAAVKIRIFIPSAGDVAEKREIVWSLIESELSNRPADPCN